jgi:hypothetical protein
MCRRDLVCGMLPGIDDVSVIREVRSRTLRKLTMDLTFADVSVGVLALGLSGLAYGLTEGFGYWTSRMLHMIVTGGLVLACGLWVRLRARRLLPKVLREMGRCIRCGYSLSQVDGSVCPECGTCNASALSKR